MALYPARFADPFDQMIDSIMGGRRNAFDGGALMRAPETDVFETEHAIRVVTEMPGLTADDRLAIGRVYLRHGNYDRAGLPAVYAERYGSVEIGSPYRGGIRTPGQNLTAPLQAE